MARDKEFPLQPPKKPGGSKRGGSGRDGKPGSPRFSGPRTSDQRSPDRAPRSRSDSPRGDSPRPSSPHRDVPKRASADREAPARDTVRREGPARRGAARDGTSAKPDFAKGSRQDSGSRGDQVERAVRGDRPQRPARTDRNDRPAADRAAQPHGDRSGPRRDRPQRAAPGSRTGSADFGERAARAGRPSQKDGARPVRPRDDERRAPPRNDRPAAPRDGSRTDRPAFKPNFRPDAQSPVARSVRPARARTDRALLAEAPATVTAAIVPATGTHDAQRIAKLLARAGIASRREIERMIAEGRIAIDGVVIDTPATIITSLRGITVDGVLVSDPDVARLFRYHKPTGLITAASDPAGRATIYDRLPAGLPRLMPVGRLDYNTEGLLLMTNDGELKRQMELPSSGVERTYRARAYGEVSQAQLEDLFMGLEIDGMRYGRIEANLERRTGRNQWIEMTLTEGKNREVRRVLEHLGLEVSRLIRTRYGPFVLEDMPVGSVDEIRPHDLEFFVAQLRKEGRK